MANTHPEEQLSAAVEHFHDILIHCVQECADTRCGPYYVFLWMPAGWLRQSYMRWLRAPMCPELQADTTFQTSLHWSVSWSTSSDSMTKFRTILRLCGFAAVMSGAHTPTSRHRNR